MLRRENIERGWREYAGESDGGGEHRERKRDIGIGVILLQIYLKKGCTTNKIVIFL
jgi:hypothetical protein